MLVLTRKRTESIKIGDDIVVKVIHTGKGTVKLGIEAPNHVRVLRGELDEKPGSSSRADSPAYGSLEEEDDDDEVLTEADALLSVEKFLQVFAEPAFV